ncbi:hypothetical protein BFP72_04000 [Reichenbachiella sp. 5M10]|nr:hypothetical protein BFP72_04000 [Reichenbachiella sp. 5M10]
MDKSDFGIYTLYTIIITFVEMSRNAFIQNGFVKYFLDKNYNKKDIISSSIWLNTTLTIVTTFALYLLADYIGHTYDSKVLSRMIRLYCLFSLCMVPYSQVMYYYSALVNFKILSVLSFIRYGSYFVLILGAILFDKSIDLMDVATLQVASIFLGGFFSIFYLMRIEFLSFSFSAKVIKELLNFGKYTFGVGLTSLLTRSVDQLMIGYFISAEAVASYNVAGRFMNFIEIPIASLSQVLYPRFAETANHPEPQLARARLFEKSSGTILAAITPFVLMIFILPSFFISIVAGQKYLDAVPILQIFMLLNLLKPFSTQAGSVLEVSGKPKVGFYALLTSTGINIVLNYYFIQMDNSFGGILGAAIASVISGASFVMIALLAINRESPFSVTNTFEQFLNAYRIGFNFLTNQIKAKL